MNIRLTPHASELLQAVRSKREEPIEQIIEHALEVLAREEHVEPRELVSGESQRRAVSEMFDFIRHNRVRLEDGLSVKDLIHEGHRL